MLPTTADLGTWNARTIVRNMFPLLIVLCSIVLIAGITLEGAEDMLREYAILAVMVPVMVDMGGNLGAILSSRMTSRFHLGTTTLDPRDRILWANVAAILALGATIFAGLGASAWVIGLIIGSTIPLGDLVLIAMTSGMAVAVIAVVFSLGTTYASYRLGIDPDDTTIPIVTNVVDVLGMVIFIGVSALVLGL